MNVNPAAKVMVNIEKLEKVFSIKRGLFKKGSKNRAVDDVSFDIRQKEMFGLVGESGCGKSTLARLILRLMDPTSGKVVVDGEDITALPKGKMRHFRRKMQAVFQDPYSSLNPRMKICDIVGRGLEIHKMFNGRRETRDEIVLEWLKRVGLGADFMDRYIHEFSGGQLQRIAIARALCVEPRFVILDEPTSALDVSIQAQICNLLVDLKEQFSLTFLFISHNLAVVKHLSDRIGIMYLGKIVETGNKEDIFSSPRHPYTEALLSASLDIDADPQQRILLPGNLKNAVDLPRGCRFSPRCFKKMPVCEEMEPQFTTVGPGHQVSCFHYQ